MPQPPIPGQALPPSLNATTHSLSNRSMIPPYLFRVSKPTDRFSAENGYVSFSSRQPVPTRDGLRKQLSDHLLWKTENSPWISTTCSLLRAIVDARWRYLRGDTDIVIRMLDSRMIKDSMVYPATDLAKSVGGLEITGKPWHDSPEGEYLVLHNIPASAVLGEADYAEIIDHVETLLPELADKPHQVTDEMRKYLHGPHQNRLLRAVKGSELWRRNHWPMQDAEIVAARSIANNLAGPTAARLSLLLMCLSLRKRNVQAINWPAVLKDISGAFPLPIQA